MLQLIALAGLLVPIGLVGGALSLAAGAALLPILLTVGLAVAVIGAVAALLALLVPAIPFVLLGLAIWAMMRRTEQESPVWKYR